MVRKGSRKSAKSVAEKRVGEGSNAKDATGSASQSSIGGKDALSEGRKAVKGNDGKKMKGIATEGAKVEKDGGHNATEGAKGKKCKAKERISTRNVHGKKGGSSTERNIAADQETANEARAPVIRRRGADAKIMSKCLESDEKVSSRLRKRKAVPSFQRIKLDKWDCERIIGKKIKIHRSGSRRWFPGVVNSFNHKTKLHKILYDDGQRQRLNLKNENFEVEVMRNDGFTIVSKPGYNSRNKEKIDDAVKIKDGETVKKFSMPNKKKKKMCSEDEKGKDLPMDMDVGEKMTIDRSAVQIRDVQPSLDEQPKNGEGGTNLERRKKPGRKGRPRGS